ncbi:probable vesicular acetylcholine transporter-B [Patiria miniata]|uniref:VAChT n=1 Tax=Patiria miniata TaxID=46514 RepID=A0A914A9G8_PATMI|nr:probable vesicular acetylcholine transporter-B [Patiria miniata]WAS27812.1 putative VAChT [Patiria miniata]
METAEAAREKMENAKVAMSEFIGTAKSRITNPVIQRRFILIIVCVALLLDNMLYMVIVPIIPDYLRSIGAWNDTDTTIVSSFDNVTNTTVNTTIESHGGSRNEDFYIGILFASKAIVQLLINPFSGTIIDRIGYDIPMVIGLSILFVATTIFACGTSYGVLFFARSMQGVGSAFADTSGLAMIADRFQVESERTKALGIALAFISFGCLVAPPFGGVLYEFVGKKMPFVTLALVAVLDGFLLLFVIKPYSERRWQMPKGTPIYKLITDPYIAVAAGALSMSNVSLAFLEPTISIWMEDTMSAVSWQTGIIWLPAFIPHVIGVIMTVKFAARYPHYQWLYAAIGLVVIGICTFIVPACETFGVLIIPLCGICYGIALVDTSLLPTLGFLVDVRHVPVYGSVYAIADISYCVAYAIGPVLAGQIVQSLGFTNLNIMIGVFNIAYAPILIVLRKVYDLKPREFEDTVLLTEEPATGLYDAVKAEAKREAKEGDRYYVNHNAFRMHKVNGNIPNGNLVDSDDASSTDSRNFGTPVGNASRPDDNIRRFVAQQQGYGSLSEQED